jgi:adenylylsulfate reductase subunit A
MAGTFDNPEVVQEEVDILIIGGGMGACGAAYEIGPWLDEAKKQGVDLKVKLVDKAAMDRSGAVAQGLSAINTYIGSEQDPADYARMVSNDLMGITRDDLAYDLGRHVDDSVHLFEEWGLPIWKQPGDEGKPLVDGGKPVRSGKWQIMINGESYKWIVAEAPRRLWVPTASRSACSSSSWSTTRTRPTPSPVRSASPYARTRSSSTRPRRSCWLPAAA